MPWRVSQAITTGLIAASAEKRNASGANSESIMRGLVPPCCRLRRDTWQLVSSLPSPVLLHESSLPSSVLLHESSLPSSVLLHESSVPSLVLPSQESLSSVEAAPQAAQLSAAAPHESAVELVGGGCGVDGG